MVIILSMMNKVTEDDLMIASKIFDRYDKDDSGDISMSEMEEHMRIAQRREEKEKANNKANNTVS